MKITAANAVSARPGIVMSLYGLWMSNPDMQSVTEIETALQGNLCRCTGYEPIIKAALQAGRAGGQAQDALSAERDSVRARLQAMQGQRIELTRDGERAIIPANDDDLAGLLQAEPGGDAGVGRHRCGPVGDEIPARYLSGDFHWPSDEGITVSDDQIRLGAGVTYSEAVPVFRDYLPQAHDYLLRIGGWQVRNMGTIGGNIANGSPIGDSPPLLIALGARIVLRKGR